MHLSLYFARKAFVFFTEANLRTITLIGLDQPTTGRLTADLAAKRCNVMVSSLDRFGLDCSGTVVPLNNRTPESSAQAEEAGDEHGYFWLTITSSHCGACSECRTVLNLRRGAVSDGRAGETETRLKPDLIVADISMPLLNGVEALRQILRQNPRARLIFLSMHPEAIYAVDATNAGAKGYLVKSADDRELVTAMQTVMGGDTYVTPSLEGLVVNRLAAAICRQRSARSPDRP